MLDRRPLAMPGHSSPPSPDRGTARATRVSSVNSGWNEATRNRPWRSEHRIAVDLRERGAQIAVAIELDSTREVEPRFVEVPVGRRRCRRDRRRGSRGRARGGPRDGEEGREEDQERSASHRYGSWSSIGRLARTGESGGGGAAGDAVGCASRPRTTGGAGGRAGAAATGRARGSGARPGRTRWPPPRARTQARRRECDDGRATARSVSKMAIDRRVIDEQRRGRRRHADGDAHLRRLGVSLRRQCFTALRSRRSNHNRRRHLRRGGVSAPAHRQRHAHAGDRPTSAPPMTSPRALGSLV